MQLLRIANAKMAADFAKQWTHKGVAIFMDETHHKFAADFANMIVTSFVESQKQAQAKAAEKAKLVLAEG